MNIGNVVEIVDFELGTAWFARLLLKVVIVKVEFNEVIESSYTLVILYSDLARKKMNRKVTRYFIYN